MGDRIFITGGTGSIGGLVASRILRDDPDAQVFLLVRARSETEAMGRVAAAFDILSPELDFSRVRDRIRVYCGDITMDRLGLDESTFKSLSEDLSHIVHCAAATKFNIDIHKARAINRQGTLNVMALAKMAKRNGNLMRAAHVSTAYVCGKRKGTILEDELISDPGFTNAYQQSKWETEQAVRGMTEELPLIILRPSIVTGGSLTGRTLAFNVLYTPLKWIYRGSIKFIPGCAEVPLDVVPLDFVAEAIRHILLKAENLSGTTFHIAAGSKYSTTVGEVLDSGTDYFKRNAPSHSMKKVRFIPPQLADIVIRLLPAKQRRSLEKMRFFEPYICIAREFDTTNTEKALKGSGISPPVFESYFENIMDFCTATQWGENLNCAA
jgi:long-chain acyl-CoA synthetase